MDNLEEITTLVSKDKLEQAFIELEKLSISQNNIGVLKEIKSNVALISSQYYSLKQRETKGLIDFNSYQIQKNKICKATLDIIGQIKYLGNHKTKGDILTSNRNKIDVEITIDRDFEDYSAEEQEKFIGAIKALLNINSELTIRKVYKGSVKMDIILPEDKAHELIRYFEIGLLKKHDVKEVRLKNEKTIPTFILGNSIEYLIQKITHNNSLKLIKTFSTAAEFAEFNLFPPISLIFIESEFLSNEIIAGSKIDFSKFNNIAVYSDKANHHSVLKAFEIAAIDYLIKGFEMEQLDELANKVSSREKSLETANRLEVLLSALDYKSEFQKIAFPTYQGMTFIEIKDIVYIESDSQNSTVNMVNGEMFIAIQSIGKLESMLKDLHFVRVNRRTIVNLNFVSRISRQGFLTLSNDIEINLSRRAKQDILDRINFNFDLVE